MRVSLAPVRVKTPRLDGGMGLTPADLLAREGPSVMLGGCLGGNGLAKPIAPRADTLFGPRGAALAYPTGPLFVCDTGHHRLLMWKCAPRQDHAPADLLIGQPDFESEGRNAKREAGAATLNVPTGVAAANGILAVADAWNHRVLIWFGYPERANRAADLVLGQADFGGCLANRGKDRAGADTLFWCYGVTLAGHKLIVADSGNRRVLVWESIPTQNGAAADLVLGQRDFTTRDENAGGRDAVGGLGMRWPHAVALADDAILVADAGNNRIMVWRELPQDNGRPCDFVIGQADFLGLDHNQSQYFPTAATLNMPYGLCVQGERLIVADTANSRLLGFELAELGMGASASRLAGQHDFTDKGDNRWGAPARDSLCWPYNVSASGDTLVISDSGNNRVLLWEAAA